MTLKHIFGTPIYEHIIENVDELNSNINSLSLDFYKSINNKATTNVMWNYKCGIWTSFNMTEKVQSILHYKKYECFNDLRNHILYHIGKYLSNFNINNEAYAIEMHDSWINIHAPNQFQEWHKHINEQSPVHFSGVYYVHVPPNSGNLLLQHYNSDVLSMWKCPFSPIHPMLSITAIPGKIVIFPCWLAHMAEKNESDTYRISIAFNFRLKV